MAVQKAAGTLKSDGNHPDLSSSLIRGVRGETAAFLITMQGTPPGIRSSFTIPREKL